MRSVKWLFIFLAAAFFSFIFLSMNSAGAPDMFIENAVYSNDQSQEQILIASGRDNATDYKYIIIDDISEAPENWSQSDFNDSSWSLGAAPFGDR